MGSRLNLQSELEELLGSRNVYFQPPESKKLVYDCIVYSKKDVWNRHADNYKYILRDCYELTVIYRNPDSELTHDILTHFQYSNFNRHFASDNLHHDVIVIYY